MTDDKGMTDAGAKPDFASMDAKSVLRELGTDAKTGLDAAEVSARQQKFGYNEIAEKKSNPALLFLLKFWGLTAWILEAIIIISWLTQKYTDALIVVALLVLNAVIGFVQEQNAAGALEALKRKLQVNARVLRGGAWSNAPARELVPGDMVRLRIGDFVPADVKILEGEAEVDQSSLTGESAAVEKKTQDALYSGSIIARGEVSGVVVLTGARTSFGRTVELVQIARPKMHIEEIISKVIISLLAIVSVVLVLTLAFSILEGEPLMDLAPLLLVLLLGAVPVALPAMFTVSMALGARGLIDKGVLVTRLSAPDDAASMDILCVDKTGTLTMNEVAVAGIKPMKGGSEEDVLLCGALASNEANHDAIDMAFINEAKKRGLALGKFAQKSFTPFDPKTRRTEALVMRGSSRFRVMKGSVGVMAELCKVSPSTRRGLDEYVAECARSGYRALAVAKSAGKAGPKLLGVVALYDPPRGDSAAIIAKLHELGVSLKMLTGDALPVAREIAARVGIGASAIKASELNEAGKADAARASAMAESSDVFAEVYPQDKYSIVKDLQARGHIVGMTGDGVNDAPALKQAEVGIAVHSASDVAKGAASIVLTQDGLASVIEPIIAGRQMFQRINTWILNKITKTILQVCFIVLAYFLMGRFIITSSAMLLLIFMIDFVTIALSTDNVKWSRRPEVWNIPALVRTALVLGSLMIAEAFGLLYIGLNYFNLSGAALNTFSFAILFYFTSLLIFVVRERERFFKSSPSRTLFSILMLDMAIAAVFATFGILGLAPIPLAATLVVIAYTAFFSLVVNDWVKTLVLAKRNA